MSQVSIIQEIKSIDVDNITHVLFTENNSKEYPIYLDSIKQIALYFNNTYNKAQFQPMELAEVGRVLIKNFESTLPSGEYNKLLQILGSWIENGGRFEIIRKNIEPLTKIQKVKKFLQIFLKIILILFSTIAGAGITCGANLSLMARNDFSSDNTTNETVWLIIWGVEILSILVILIHKFFKRKSSGKENIEPSLLKLIFWLIIVTGIIIVVGSIFSDANFGV